MCIHTLPWQKTCHLWINAGKHTQGTTGITDYPNDTQALSYTKLLYGCKISEGLLSESDYAHCPKSHRSVLHTMGMQFPNELSGQGTYSRFAVQKPGIRLENRLRRRPRRTRTLNKTVPDNWSFLLLADESRFNLAYCDRRVRVWRTAGEKYIHECLYKVIRNRIVFVMVWGSSATTVLTICSFSMKTGMRTIIS